VTIAPADQARDERVTPGTRADRNEKLSTPMRVRYGVVIGICVIAAFGAEQGYEAGQRIERDERAQIKNRVSNVNTWCSAINLLQRDLNAYVILAAKNNVTTNLPPLGLRPLPCTAIEHRTQASGPSR
jgi:hypothetical protein